MTLRWHSLLENESRREYMSWHSTIIGMIGMCLCCGLATQIRTCHISWGGWRQHAMRTCLSRTRDNKCSAGITHGSAGVRLLQTIIIIIIRKLVANISLLAPMIRSTCTMYNSPVPYHHHMGWCGMVWWRQSCVENCHDALSAATTTTMTAATKMMESYRSQQRLYYR